MPKLFPLVAAALWTFAAGTSAAEPEPGASPVKVMVLGTWHFANPGLDLNNIESDDVLTPKRQAELAAVASALATFRPTRIMIERIAPAPDLADPLYASFDPGMLSAQRDERFQIGYRVARQLGLGRIGGYYDLLAIGDTAQQPGDDLNAMWYLRNAKIFAKLVTVARPGDRVLVVYGSGHNYWLRHFARETPGFANVDPVPYLLRAGAARTN